MMLRMFAVSAEYATCVVTGTLSFRGWLFFLIIHDSGNRRKDISEKFFLRQHREIRQKDSGDSQTFLRTRFC